jgi:N4-gp56 family major capsid protein
MSGTDPMSASVERITDLTKTERGDKAVITLVPDLEGDGVVGDSELEGREEEAKAYDQSIEIDQLRNATKSAGRMAEQKSVVRFREQSRDLLGHWLADRTDQVASMVASGQDFRLKTNGSFRKGFSADGSGGFSRDSSASGAPSGQALYDLSFADDVTAPSTNRHMRWDSSASELKDGDVTAVESTDTPSYGMLVEAKAYAKDRRLKPIRMQGAELYHVLMHPKALAKLKLDKDFLANLRDAGPRGKSNPLFSGTVMTVDGLVIHEWTHSWNTLGATAGSSSESGYAGYKWGSDAQVNGNRILLMGAQALAFADIDVPQWNEDTFDYNAKPGIAVGKISGFKKPVFYSPMDGSAEDFGTLAVDVAL